MAQKNVRELLGADEDTQKGKLLTFAMGKETYAIEICHVTEIVGIQEITDVPEQPPYVRGIINLRGKIVPVIDVRLRFKKPFREYDDRTCVIVVDVKELLVGLIVDSVSEVISIPEEEIVPAPEIYKSSGSRCVKGIGKVGNEIKLLLDCEKLLGEEDLTDLGRML